MFSQLIDLNIHLSSQKKAVFLEPQTQLASLGKSQETPKVMGPLSTPTKGSEAPGGEPWTPTSNLKMLISAASAEIRNREKEKNSSEEAENSSQVNVTMRNTVGFFYILLTKCCRPGLMQGNEITVNIFMNVFREEVHSLCFSINLH